MMLVLLLASCASKQGTSDNSASELDNYEVLSTNSEVNEGDFVYRLVTEKAEYRINESVKIFAELEYVGNSEEVVIFHAASPFYFPMIEKTRNYEIGYPMKQPLESTTLKKGHPLRYNYSRSGGYGSQDEEQYVKFMRSFLEDGFPIGYYVVNGFVDYYVEDSEKNKQDFNIKGQIDFKVQDNN
jgi:hypothetical protein